MPAPEARFAALDADEAREVLARNHIGRLAYCLHDRVDIRPLSYVFADPWIWGRTSVGDKIGTLQRNWWVAFEVDEVDNAYEWRSVVVHGGFYLFDPEGSAQDRAYYSRVRETLAAAMADAFGHDDPVPGRTLIFGIALQEVAGRMGTRSGTP